MAKVEIPFDLERSQRMYRKYLNYQLNKTFRPEFFWGSLGIGIVLVLIGLITQISFYAYIGMGMIIFILLIKGYYQYYVEKEYRRYIDPLQKLDLDHGSITILTFDDSMISLSNSFGQNEIYWKAIQQYEVHEDDIYLYSKDSLLITILAREALGDKSFFELEELLRRKLKPQPRTMDN